MIDDDRRITRLVVLAALRDLALAIAGCAFVLAGLYGGVALGLWLRGLL